MHVFLTFVTFINTHHNFDNPESTQITPVNLLSSIIPKLYANQLAYYKYNNKGYFALSLIVCIHFQLTAVAFAVVVAFLVVALHFVVIFFRSVLSINVQRVEFRAPSWPWSPQLIKHACPQVFQWLWAAAAVVPRGGHGWRGVACVLPRAAFATCLGCRGLLAPSSLSYLCL